jgi:arylsulfatase A-like enzyme
MPKEQPNIIYILGDDHRVEQLGCMGHPILRTPNLDALAADGVLFTDAFCTSPACTPSRTSHYTGQWERRHGINFNSGSSLHPDAWDNSFPMRLKQAGYYLGWVGKNHVPVGSGRWGYDSGHLEDVFNYWYGNHHHSGFYPKEQAMFGDANIYGNAKADTQAEIFEEGVLNFLDPQEAFIAESSHPLPRRPKDQPFCLCVTFNLPHAHGTGNMQLRPTDDELYITEYRDRFEDVPLPSTYVPFGATHAARLPGEVYNGICLAEYDYVRTPQALRERRIREYQAITGMDRVLGNLREALEALGLADNTIIVFSTDHGIHHGEHGLGGKCLLYEEDIRIPLIIYDPRQDGDNSSQRRDELVAVPDLAPTMLDLCGLDIPDSMQGRSLAPLLAGEQPEWRQAIFTEQLMDIQNYPRSESVRTREWKYIRYFARTEDPSQADKLMKGTLDDYNACLSSTLTGEQPIYEELFSLKNDPGETKNLATNPQYESELHELRAELHELAVEAKGDDAPPLTIPFEDDSS